MSSVTVGIIGAGNVIWAYLSGVWIDSFRGSRREWDRCARGAGKIGPTLKPSAGNRTWWRIPLKSCNRMQTWCSSSLLRRAIHVLVERRSSMVSTSW